MQCTSLGMHTPQVSLSYNFPADHKPYSQCQPSAAACNRECPVRRSCRMYTCACLHCSDVTSAGVVIMPLLSGSCMRRDAIL